MPREDRRIIFEFQETYKALYTLCMEQDISRPPAGMVAAVTGHPVDKEKILVHLENPHSNFQQRVEFTHDFLANALVRYCQNSRIPLPMAAEKSLDFTPDHVVLRMVA